MPWWSWILIWTVLVLILLGVLVLGAVYLWKKLKGLTSKLGQAQDLLEPAFSQGVALTAKRPSRLPVGPDAVQAEPIEVRAGLREEKQDRKDARRLRRIEALFVAGRPRRYSDLDVILDDAPEIDAPA